MSTDEADPFSDTYAEARRRFLAAVHDRGGTVVDTFCADGDDTLCTDVALLGDRSAQAALVLVSGTHGVEGFAGSACQLDFLRNGIPEGIAVVAVHALNPFGFTHRRRVNEENVDVNRNFVDHGAAPENAGYSALHPILTRGDWSAAGSAAVAEELQGFAERVGARAVQEAVTRGQYAHPDGLFYGGCKPTWSNRVWRTVIDRHLSGYRTLGYIDLHTGLGARGNAEPIFRGGRDADALARARRWYGSALTESEAGTSSSTPIGGNTAHALAEELGESVALTAITLEFGTEDPLTVLWALQADNWMWLQSDVAPERRKAVVALMTRAFAPDDTKWRHDVVTNGREFIRSAASQLAQ